MGPTPCRPSIGLLAALAIGLFTTLASRAQAPATPAAPTVLKGDQVTESNLIDALAVDAPAPAASAVRMRGFRPTLGADAGKPGPGKASLQVTFATDSADLTDEARGVLDTLGRALNSERLARHAFKVEGHADARGDARRNLQLSQLRAESVAAYLTARHGVGAQRLTAVGRGSSEPLNTQRLDAPENRRVTIITLPH